jgi:hypothetical protein
MSGTISSMSYVTDGREAIGFVLARGRAGYEALDREQRSLGLSKTAAAAASTRSSGEGVAMGVFQKSESQRQRRF